MKKRDDVFIAEMLQRIRAVKGHLNKVTQDKFMKSELHKSAVVRELEVLGEAAKPSGRFVGSCAMAFS